MRTILKKTTFSLSLLAMISTSTLAEDQIYTFNINTSNGKKVTKTIKTTNDKVEDIAKNNMNKNKSKDKNQAKSAVPEYNDLYSHKKQKQIKQYNTLNKIKRHNSLNQTITDLAQRLLDSSRVDHRYLEDIAITSFVDLHKFNKTSRFGRNVSESFFDELFSRGFNVSEFRGQDNLSINTNGEYFLTRDPKLLKKIVKNKYVLVGTYSKFEDSILLSARIINNTSGRIVASARSYYNTDNCKLLESCPKVRRINIIAEDDYLVKNVVKNPSNYYKETKSKKTIILKTSKVSKLNKRKRARKNTLSLVN